MLKWIVDGWWSWKGCHQWVKGSHWISSNLSIVLYIPDGTDCPCSLKLCCHGSLNPTRAVRPVWLWFREAEWLETHTRKAQTVEQTPVLSHWSPLFFSSVIAHMHISHHKDSSCQGQRGPRFSLSVDYKHTRRWPARPVYPQMATVEWNVWKVSATPAWPLCRRARLCHTSTLARTQLADVGMANPHGSECRPEETATRRKRNEPQLRGF